MDTISRNLEVSRPLPPHDIPENTVDGLGSRCRIFQDGRVHGHLAEDLELALVSLHDMVQVNLVITPAKRHLRSAAYNQER